MKKKQFLGQITVRKIGSKYLVCISGTPKKMYNDSKSAESHANKLRIKHGRRPKRPHKNKR